MHDLYSNSSFLLERTKIEKSFKTSNQLEYVIHIKNLKQALNHGLILKNVLESLNLMKKLIWNYIYEYWAKKKNYFEKEFFNLTNNAVFRKTMENLKIRDLKLTATETRRNYLMSEPNLHTTKKFSGNF